jgi:hypothetical protein
VSALAERYASSDHELVTITTLKKKQQFNQWPTKFN